MLFKLSHVDSNLVLTLGYLIPALNNSAQFEEQDANFARFRTHALMPIFQEESRVLE